MNFISNNIFSRLLKWIEENPLSYDVLDIKSQKNYIRIIKHSQKSRFNKIITAPFIILSEKYTNFFRKIFRVKKQTFPQANALIARSYLANYSISKEKKYLDKAIDILNWLENNPSKGYKNYCWGQPYNWYSRKLIPAFTPRATVTTQVANAFLDAYEITKESKYLEIAIESCNFFINDLQWKEDENNNICFSYTSLDNYNIHNANMLIAATLIRTWSHSKIEQFKNMGLKSMNFTISHQNENGSWFYWAPPDKIVGRIDNYHTGFILESFEVIRNYLGAEFKNDNILDKGLEYYLKNLFNKENVPKMTNKVMYPIDIQSCAQAIITLCIIGKRKPELNDIAMKIANWTVQNLYDDKGFFYYRLYKNGKIDKTPYMRWSESWMLRALSFFNKKIT